MGDSNLRWEPMFGKFGRIEQDRCFVSGRHSNEYTCGTMARKQWHTGCLDAVLWTTNSLCGTNLFILYVLPKRCMWDLTLLSDTLYCFSSLPHVQILSCLVATCRASSSKGYCGTFLGSSQRDKTPDLNFWNQHLAVRSFTALSPHAWYMRRPDAAVDKLALKSWCK